MAFGWEAEGGHGGRIADGGFGEGIVDGAEEVFVVDGDGDGFAIANDFLFFTEESFERWPGDAGAIDGVAGGADGGVVCFGVGDGIFGGADVGGECAVGSSAEVAQHGVPAGVFKEGEVGGFEFDDPADVFVAVFFLSDEGR